MEIKGKLSTVLQGSMIVLIALLCLGFFIGSSRGMPEYAHVFVDDKARTYFAPACVERRPGLRFTTAREARNLKYRPDRKCKNEGGFIQDDRSLTGHLLQKIGILKPIPSRWNPDGTWNW